MESPTCEEYVNSDAEAFWSAFVLPRVILIEGTTSRHRTGSKARAQQMLDNELSAMHLAMCCLRTRRNALSPISALPAEVLVHIFEFCAAIYPPAPYKEQHLGWIEVTHVCRLWRDTAIQLSSLWSNIYFRLGSQWAEVMLARAKTAPINLRKDVSVASQRSLDLISEHIPRARELSLIGPINVIKSIIFTSPPPSEILKAIELRPDNVSGLDIPSTNFELPGAIVGSRLPSLRRLALRAFWIPWSAPILCGLTHLEMQLHRPRNPADDGYLNSSHEKIFCALMNMPGLETLILMHCFPPGPWKDGGSDVLQLPRLKVLQLEGSSAACFGIPKRLLVPPSCQVQLRCSDYAIHTTEIVPFLIAYASASADLPLWHTLSINADYDRLFTRLRMWRLCDALEGTVQFNPETNADLIISFYSPEPSLGPLIPLCQALPLRNILTVCIDYTLVLDPEVRDWVDILGQCKELQAASISAEPAPTSFFTALSMTTDCKPAAGLQTSGQEQLFLGKLAVLELTDVDFRFWQSEDSGDALHSLLIRSLTNRQRAKAALMLDIGLLWCSIKEEWVDDLRKVAIVTWDGREGECGFDGDQEWDNSGEDEDGDEDEDEW
ncbi:hypothetical protein EWM64_g2316 [Hericium alpestre]|uniref:F-box domain-containing protein n=1 Tax=Hericium alpestre TaxID=135208 RepID=A0A4Z0A5U1_9AGAM|nr:hypothetical protein EWM64_g2316 [Hericium alpestre]